MVWLAVISGAFCLIAVVAAFLATQADNGAQRARNTSLAVLDTVRGIAAKGPGVAEMSAGSNPYRSLPAKGETGDQLIEVPPMSTQILYVSSVHDENNGKVSVYLSKYGPDKMALRVGEDKISIDCPRTASPVPGDEVEVVTRRKTT